MLDYSKSTFLTPAAAQQSTQKRTYYSTKQLTDLLEFRNWNWVLILEVTLKKQPVFLGGLICLTT